VSLAARVSPPSHPAAQAHPAVQALHAEWTKLRTLAGPAWLLAGAVWTVGALLLGALVLKFRDA
jgi:hypothetical protein